MSIDGIFLFKMNLLVITIFMFGSSLLCSLHILPYVPQNKMSSIVSSFERWFIKVIYHNIKLRYIKVMQVRKDHMES